jgi:hypothetical protein
MVKARVAPATEILEDVVRDPRQASSEDLPWRYLFALSHFLEGFQRRCLRQNSREAVLPARSCQAPSVDFSLCRKKEVKASPSCGEGSFEEKVSLLAWRKWHTREGS